MTRFYDVTSYVSFLSVRGLFYTKNNTSIQSKCRPPQATFSWKTNSGIKYAIRLNFRRWFWVWHGFCVETRFWCLTSPNTRACLVVMDTFSHFSACCWPSDTINWSASCRELISLPDSPLKKVEPKASQYIFHQISQNFIFPKRIFEMFCTLNTIFKISEVSYLVQFSFLLQMRLCFKRSPTKEGEK